MLLQHTIEHKEKFQHIRVLQKRTQSTCAIELQHEEEQFSAKHSSKNTNLKNLEMPECTKRLN